MTPFEAIAEPNRRAILDLLRTGERPAGDLVEATGLSQPGVSKHLKLLREAGLVSVRPDGQRRLYRLEPGELAVLDDWLRPFRSFWADRLDALANHLEEMNVALPPPPPPGRQAPPERHACWAGVTATGDALQVVFRRHYRAPVEKVWAALTTPERLADWFAQADVDLRVGGTIRLNWNNRGGTDMRITVCDPPRAFAWVWKMSGRDTLVRFDLSPDAGGCLLTLTHSGVPLSGDGVRAGWHAHLEGLTDALEGRALAAWSRPPAKPRSAMPTPSSLREAGHWSWPHPRIGAIASGYWRSPVSPTSWSPSTPWSYPRR